jgi:hypothetical protein
MSPATSKGASRQSLAAGNEHLAWQAYCLKRPDLPKPWREGMKKALIP